MAQSAKVDLEGILRSPRLDTEEKLRVIEQLRIEAKQRTVEAEKRLRSDIDYVNSNNSVSGSEYPSSGESDLENDGKTTENSRSSEFFFSGSDSDSESQSKSSCSADENDRLESEKYFRESEKAKERRRTVKRKFDWKQQHLQLAHRAQFLEREISTILTHSRNQSLRKEYLEVERTRKVELRERQLLRKELGNQLQKAQTSLSLVRSHTQKVGQGDQYLIRLQELIESCEGWVSSSKRNSSLAYNKLSQLEDDLTHQTDGVVLEMVHRMEELQKLERTRRRKSSTKMHPPINTQSPRKPNSNSNDESNRDSLHDEIQKLDEEIAMQGGCNGHWDERDHASFLQLLSRFKIRDNLLLRWKDSPEDLGENEKQTLERFVSKAISLIPLQDASSILSHLEWYSNYQQLVTRKREVVACWRKQRYNASPRTKSLAENDSLESNKKSVKVRQDERRRNAKLQENKRKQVQDWKAQKATMKRIEEERLAAAKALKRQADLQEKLKRDKKKESILLFRKEQAMRSGKEEKETQNKRANSAKTAFTELSPRASRRKMEDLQERDRKIAMKRMQDRKKLLRPTREEQIAKLVAPKVPKVSRDSNRVTRPTRANLGHRLTEEELHELRERRKHGNAHASVVPSTFGGGTSGRTYDIGVRHMMGHVSRKAASWRSGANR